MFRIFEKSLRLFAATFIFIYGVVKPWQFENAFASTNTAVNELDGMSLMWAFFGYSVTVPVVIGIFECVGATLLIFDKTKLLGAIILLPILGNIVLFDLVYKVVPFATMNGIIYLAIILFVCFEQRQKLREAFDAVLCHSDVKESNRTFSVGRILAMIGFLTLNWIVFVALQIVGHSLLAW